MHPDTACRRDWNSRGQSYVLAKGVDVFETSDCGSVRRKNVTSGHVTHSVRMVPTRRRELASPNRNN